MVKPDLAIRVTEAVQAADLDLVRTLFREYQQAIGVDLCFQGFAAELAALPGAYARPGGRLLLAWRGEALAGCGALRPLGPTPPLGVDTPLEPLGLGGPGIAELKRMWSRPAQRGHGVARVVAEALLAAARDQGYRAVRLDTLEWMTAARALYRSLGFVEIDPYYPNPLPGVVYMELAIQGHGGSDRA